VPLTAQSKVTLLVVEGEGEGMGAVVKRNLAVRQAKRGE
jgi:hypothetical protein